MKIIDCDWTKRNGNGQSTCHLCKTLTWDSFCYDFELKILDKELFNTVLCDDCISRIKQGEKTEILQEVEDKEYEELEELEIQHIEDTQHLIMKDTINALIRNQKYILERLDNGK